MAEINESLASQYVIPNSSVPEWNSTARNFTVRLNFSQLLDPERGAAYRIDPRTEPVKITITEFDRYLNKTDTSVENATLKDVTFWKMDPTVPMPRFTRIPFSYSTEDPDLYTLSLDGTPDDLVPRTNVSHTISLVLKPSATSGFTLDQNSILDIRFNFEDNPPRTNINGTFLYDYDHVDLPALKPAVLEVAIW